MPAKIPEFLHAHGLKTKVIVLGDGRLAFAHGKPRKVVKRSSLEALRSAWDDVALSIVNAETAAVDVSAEDRRIYLAAKTHLAPLGLAVDTAAREIAAVLTACTGATIRDLGAAWQRTQAREFKRRTVAQMKEALLAEKNEIDLSGRRKRDLRNDLATFEAAFGERFLDEITSDEILAWVRRMQQEGQLGWKRRNHLRDIACCLFLYAQSKGFLPKNEITAAEAVPRLKAPKRDGRQRPVYTVAEMQAWIANIKPKFRPWLLICGFSMVRSEEVSPDPETNKDPLRWEDIELPKRRIRVRPETSKTGEQRYVPMPDNLVEFMEEYRGHTGVICPGEQPSKRETGRLGKISCAEIVGADGVCRVVPVKWKTNALRHTSISARLAITKSAAVVAYEAGTSERKITSNYNEGLSEEEAAAWYNIWPKHRAQNVLPLFPTQAA